MKLSEEIKNKIVDIIDVQLKNSTYEGLTEEKRIKLGQVYTPAKICIQMIEMYETEDFSGMNILDPTCGSGNLLIAMLIAGADSDKLFGNEYDETIIQTCRDRINTACELLNKPKINDWQIHQGNGLITECLTIFGPEYDDVLEELLKRRNGMSGGFMNNPDKWEEYKKKKTRYNRTKEEQEKIDKDKEDFNSMSFDGLLPTPE